jgi:glycosyltransferase involved in cell wall biosynthesis
MWRMHGTSFERQMAKNGKRETSEGDLGAGYRFAFVLTTCLGNQTTYANLRKYAERDRSVACTWSPIDYQAGDTRFERWLRVLPEFLYWRVLPLFQARKVLRRLNAFDAVVVHQFEVSSLLALWRPVSRSPALVNITDDTPLVNPNPDEHPMYPNELARTTRRQRSRLAIDLWRVRRTDISILMSNWAADILVTQCGVPRDKVHGIPVGLDLEIWPRVSNKCCASEALVKILFVGGDFKRKGGDLLLDVHQQRFADRCELHIVTRNDISPAGLRNVFVYNDIRPEDPLLRELNAAAEIFVLPTTSDLTPWVCLEAMASGCAVISTKVGGIPELVRHEYNGLLIDKGDAGGLARALDRLLGDPTLRSDMGARGREMVENEHNAEINVQRILRVLKDTVDTQAVSGLRRRTFLDRRI